MNFKTFMEQYNVRIARYYDHTFNRIYFEFIYNDTGKKWKYNMPHDEYEHYQMSDDPEALEVMICQMALADHLKFDLIASVKNALTAAQTDINPEEYIITGCKSKFYDKKFHIEIDLASGPDQTADYNRLSKLGTKTLNNKKENFICVFLKNVKIAINRFLSLIKLRNL